MGRQIISLPINFIEGRIIFYSFVLLNIPLELDVNGA
jgi:hypothetical protein